MKLLFVEDDIDLRSMYGAALGLDGHEVEYAGTAQEALDKLDQDAFGALILDLLLPGSNGLAVLQELQGYEDWRGIPVIVLSNVTVEDLAISDNHLKNLGVSAYLVKMETVPQDLALAVRQLSS